MIGKVLYSSSVHTSGAYTEKIPTDNLAKGVYLLRITTHKGMVTKKLTIQ
ncbi:MAG: T9SS type A sorting domain-containing protein [Bacteroidales bacterium]|jgi:hypothetical protein|nr:T9SS type A sorting domain-containing protein [Bacteroidales bacterium]